MSKTKKQLLQELLDLETSDVEEVEDIGGAPPVKPRLVDEITETIDGKENDERIQKAKKPRSQKQQEAFERAKAIRDANTQKRKEEKRLQEEEERKMIE